MVLKQIFVSGKVQGVFFRESTRQQANTLRLHGGVRNLRDGRVEVLVRGESEAVESLINWLKIGPNFAKVTNIKVIDLTSHPELEQDSTIETGFFQIWPTK